MSKHSTRNAPERGILRIQFAFHPLTVQLLEKLVRERGAPSKAEVVRDALSIFEWVHDHVKRGYKILAAKDGELEEHVNQNIFPRDKSVSLNAPPSVLAEVLEDDEDVIFFSNYQTSGLVGEYEADDGNDVPRVKKKHRKNKKEVDSSRSN